MSKLSASMVVDLVDKTGGKTKTIIGNLDRLQRAERDYMLADRGARLSSRDRAMERMMIARHEQARMDVEERQRTINTWLLRGTAASAAVGVVAARAYTNFAETERQVNRIVINADKGAEAIRPVISHLQKVAIDARMAFGEVKSGFETLVASGRTLEESLGFLPSVAVTAQASGAAISDVALSADAMAGSMKIGAAQMQRAFDILVAGGKAGKFELKDMSQYLPSLLPAFAALGYEGTEGLQKIVAMLQVVRNQAGSSSEAATYLGNVFNKMYSEETAKKFDKFGVDLPRALDKAKREGKDVLDVFLEMTQMAIKGDLSKLTRLFTDSEMQKGVRALITQRYELEKLTLALGKVDGTALKDFNQIAGDSAAKIQKMSNLWDKFATQLGSGVATVANPTLEAVTSLIDDASAKQRAVETYGSNEELEKDRQEFSRRYSAAYPDVWQWNINDAYGEAMAKLGRGDAKSIFDDLAAEEGRRVGGRATGQYPSRGTYDASVLEEERARRAEAIDRHYDVKKGPWPTPVPRPSQVDGGQLPVSAGYPSRGSYGPQQYGDTSLRPGQKNDVLWDIERMTGEGQKIDAGRDSDAGGYFDFLSDRRFWVRDDASLKDALKIDVPNRAPITGSKRSMEWTGDTQPKPAVSPTPAAAASQGPQEVSLSGTPTVITQPSGVQQVQVTNQPPPPNLQVSVVVHANSSADPWAIGEQVGQEVGRKVRDELAGIQADTGWAVG